MIYKQLIFILFISLLLLSCKKEEVDLEVSFATDNPVSGTDDNIDPYQIKITLNATADRDIYIKYVVYGTQNEDGYVAMGQRDFKLLDSSYFVIKKGQQFRSIPIRLLNPGIKTNNKPLKFVITNVYGAKLKEGGDVFIFSIIPSAPIAKGSATIIMDGTTYTTSKIKTELIGRYYRIQFYFGNLLYPESFPYNTYYILNFEATSISPAGTIHNFMSGYPPPETGTYAALGQAGSVYDGLKGTPGNLKIVSINEVDKTLKLEFQGTFQTKTISGSADLTYYSF
jgi:hypothetical protein